MEFKVLTPNGTYLDLQVEQVTIPSKEGYAEILEEHLDYATSLTAGKVEYEAKNKQKGFFWIEDGFLTVKSNTITLIASTIYNTANDVKQTWEKLPDDNPRKKTLRKILIEEELLK